MSAPALDKAQVRAHCEQLAHEAELLRMEQERADRLRAQLASDELMARLRVAGTGECAHDDPTLPTWRDVLGVAVIDIALALAVIVVWGIFGLILRDPMRAVLTVLGVFQ